MSIFFRVLVEQDKATQLTEAVDAVNSGRHVEDVYVVDPESFRQVPNTPFCYWVSDRIRRLFTELPPFESDGRTVKQGLVTADDFRFVRAWWEVPAERILDGMQVCSRQRGKRGGEKWTEERIREFQAWCRKRTYEGKRWVPFAKGGEYSPYYADIHLVVNWERDGAEIRSFVDPETGRTYSRPQNTDYYFRPGLTWPRSTIKGLNVRVLPGACIFADKGPAGFSPELLQVCTFVGLFNSEWYHLLLGLQQGSRAWEVGTVQKTAIPDLADGNGHGLIEGTFRAWSLKRSLDLFEEVSHAFTLPALLQVQGETITERAAAYEKEAAEIKAGLRRIQSEIDEITFDLYGFTEVERRAVGRERYAVGSRYEAGEEIRTDEEEDDDIETRIATPASLTAYCLQHTAYFLSWCVGVAFGRFDIRLALATDHRQLTTNPPDPFDPLPVCPPGMLVGPDGLPAKPGGIVSEAWLGKRAEGSMQYADGKWTIAEGDDSLPTARCLLPTDADYPVRVQWDGILVEDSMQHAESSRQSKKDDIVVRMRKVLDLLWGDRAQEVEQEACEVLGVRDLRDYFRRPFGFFQDHLKRYSKSRRKAPIYWPLSTASGSYTIWLYYHRLTDQTLYAAVNKYLEPKITEVEYAVGSMQKAVEVRARGESESLPTAYSVLPTGQLRRKLDEARSFLHELEELRDELLRVAQLPYKPDLNDGVIINAAPLHKLFRLRSWAKETEKIWKKLEKGDYDWAHMAYTIRPDRVREVCRRGRSIAVAHGLEDICEVEPPVPKKKGGHGRRRKEAAR